MVSQKNPIRLFGLVLSVTLGALCVAFAWGKPAFSSAGGDGREVPVSARMDPASSAQLGEVCADFEAGALPPFMVAETTITANASGRVQVTARYGHGGFYAVDMDTACITCGDFTRQAVVMSVDLGGAAGAALQFWVWSHEDDIHAEDGVFISDDGGATYAQVVSFNNYAAEYVHVSLDLGAAAAAAGMTLTDGFLIKFQGYDNYAIPTDGYSLDDVCVCSPPPEQIDVAISRTGEDGIQLAWNDTGAAAYEVWYARDAPQLAPGADCSNPGPYRCEVVAGTTFSAQQMWGHPEYNYTFVVVTRNACGLTTALANVNPVATFTFPFTGTLPPNLAVSQEGNAAVVAGSLPLTLTYTLHYSNTSAYYAASNATLTETLPADTSFNGALSTAGWHRVGASDSYTLSLGALAPGGSGSAVFAVTVDDALPWTATNRAEIGDRGRVGDDPDARDDATTLTTTFSYLPDGDGDDLPDWVETNTGVYAGPSDAGTDPGVADSDGDGIGDGDEVRGTAAGLDLPGMGASPLRQNILLEYDWFDDNLEPETCAAHSHRPTQAALDRVSAAFAAAPVLNPDGSTGITLIQDYGQGGVFNGGNLIADADGVLSGGVNGAEFLAHKEANFATNRHGYFYYVMLPHRYNTSSPSSGQAELPGDDSIVSLHCKGTDDRVAHTVMHELGHNLWLHHGGNGNDACNYKPNYNSVMNYRYQWPGVDNNCTPPGDGVLDYSVGDRISLNENALDENAGTCGTKAWDWDGSGTIDNPVTVDVNSADGNQVNACGGTLTVLEDHDDWASLYFGGLNSADGALLFPQQIISEDPLPEWVPEQGPAAGE